MASQSSPTKAATAVSQALGEIGLPPSRNPPASSLLKEGNTLPRRYSKDPTTTTAQRSRAVPFSPSLYGRPWKTALGNQLQHIKNENARVAEKKLLDAGAIQPHTAIAVHDVASVHDPTEADHRSARSPFRPFRVNEVAQKHFRQQTQLEQKRQQQHKAEIDSSPNYSRDTDNPSTSDEIKPGSMPSSQAVCTPASSGQPMQVALAITEESKPREPPVLALLRRKQTHHRHQSQPPPSHQRYNSCIVASVVPSKQPQTLFFQTTGEDRKSSVENCSIAEPSVVSPTFDTEAADENTTSEEPTQNRYAPARKNPGHIHRRDLSRRPSDERSGDDSSFRGNGLPERIGKLSQQEDEFDFAILLKPSKYEEHVELPETAVKSIMTLKPITKVDASNVRTVIVNRIRHTGLHVKRLLSLDGKQSLLKVRAPQRVLELGAERLRLRKQRRFDQVWMVFSCELRSSFADFDPVRKCINFLDSEKQSIVHALLTASESDGGAGLNESCPIATRYVLQMYPLHKQDLALLKTRWVTFWRTSLLPSKHQHDSTPPSGSKCSILRSVLHQPLDDVAQYFGERVAFYFAWMEMYTRWLMVPSVAGVVLFVLQVHSHHLDHPAAPIYALFMALWTSAFIIAWRRRAAVLAYRWGTWGYEDEEVTRPEFYGDESKPRNVKESVNDKPGERHYPLWKRLLKYSITIPCVTGSIISVVTVAYFAFSTRDRLEAESLATKHEAAQIAQKVTKSGTITLEDLRALAQLGVRWDFWIYLLLTPILYGLLIPVLDAAFTRAARSLNNWENHRTESRYQSHLILKVFSFRFVHVFASLYYYAFAPQGEKSSSSSTDGETSKSDGMVRVAIQLASFMVTGQLWKNVMETLYPFVRRRLDARAKKRATNQQFNESTVFNGIGAATAGPRGPNLHRSNAAATTRLAAEAMMSSNAVIHEQCVRLEQASDRAWEEAGLKRYDTFEDYTEMLVQFGYVSFFSLAFPLAPLLALLNNLLELRTDAFKLCHTRQRPLAHKASGIGVWLHVLQIMSVLAVLTNCFHLAYSTSLLERAFPALTATQKVWIVFGIEHLLLVLKVWLACVVPSVPRDVSESLRREREHAKHDSARAMATRMLAETTESSDVSAFKQGSVRQRRIESRSEGSA